jgi:hypothetical protein
MRRGESGKMKVENGKLLIGIFFSMVRFFSMMEERR